MMSRAESGRPTVTVSELAAESVLGTPNGSTQGDSDGVRVGRVGLLPLKRATVGPPAAAGSGCIQVFVTVPVFLCFVVTAIFRFYSPGARISPKMKFREKAGLLST
jgi:hypothetical protein